MYRRTLFTILIILLLTPMVSANPFLDFWNWLIGADDIGIDLNNSESIILNERVERLYYDNVTITEVLYSGDKFDKLNDRYYYFNEFVVTEELNNDVRFNYLDGSYITMQPLINSEDDVSGINLGQLNYNVTIEDYRDYSKFTTHIRIVDGLNRLGFRIVSNVDLSYRDYEYTPSGVYRNEPEKYNVTRIYAGNKVFDYTDLIDSGYLVSFDKRTNILWIDVSELSGDLSLDPVTNYNSKSNDGNLNFVNIPFSCIGADSTSTTAEVNWLGSTGTQSWGFMMFNTSTIPDTADINFVNLKVYAHSYTTQAVNPLPGNLWEVGYQSNNVNYSGLDCTDWLGTWTGEGFNEWDGVTGWIVEDIAKTSLNVTGNDILAVRMFPDWEMQGADNSRAKWRTLEYGGSSAPKLEISYFSRCEGKDGDYTGGNWEINESVNCTKVEFEINGNLTINDTGRLYINKSNVTMNTTMFKIIVKDGGELYIKDSGKIWQKQL